MRVKIKNVHANIDFVGESTKPKIVMSEEEMWSSFKTSIDYFSRMDFLKSDFKRDVIDAGETLIYARDNIVELERKFEYYEKNKEKLTLEQLENLKYEISEMLEYISARMEDVDYFMQRLKDFDWKKGIRKDLSDPELIEEVMKYLDIIKRKYEILYEMLQIREKRVREELLFLDLEILIKMEKR